MPRRKKVPELPVDESPEELLEAMNGRIRDWAEGARALGMTMVWALGCYDPLLRQDLVSAGLCGSYHLAWGLARKLETMFENTADEYCGA